MAGFLRGTAGARVLSPTAPVTLFPTSNRSIAAWLKPSNCASQGVKPHIATVTANIGGKSIQMQAPPSPQGFLLGMGEDEPFFLSTPHTAAPEQPWSNDSKLGESTLLYSPGVPPPSPPARATQQHDSQEMDWSAFFQPPQQQAASEELVHPHTVFQQYADLAADPSLNGQDMEWLQTIPSENFQAHTRSHLSPSSSTLAGSSSLQDDHYCKMTADKARIQCHNFIPGFKTSCA
eukprot:scaffold41569_cov17-Tisochrysis_lutea.AAC.1